MTAQFRFVRNSGSVAFPVPPRASVLHPVEVDDLNAGRRLDEYEQSLHDGVARRLDSIGYQPEPVVSAAPSDWDDEDAVTDYRRSATAWQAWKDNQREQQLFAKSCAPAMRQRINRLSERDENQRQADNMARIDKCWEDMQEDRRLAQMEADRQARFAPVSR